MVSASSPLFENVQVLRRTSRIAGAERAGRSQEAHAEPAICRRAWRAADPARDVHTEIEASDCARRCDNCVELCPIDRACPMAIRAIAEWAGWMGWADVEHHLPGRDLVEV